MVNTTELRVYMTRCNNMTISELAKEIGKSPATVSRWFENKDMPVSYAEIIAKILGIPQKEMISIFFASFVA